MKNRPLFQGTMAPGARVLALSLCLLPTPLSAQVRAPDVPGTRLVAAVYVGYALPFEVDGGHCFSAPCQAADGVFQEDVFGGSVLGIDLAAPVAGGPLAIVASASRAITGRVVSVHDPGNIEESTTVVVDGATVWRARVGLGYAFTPGPELMVFVAPGLARVDPADVPDLPGAGEPYTMAALSFGVSARVALSDRMGVIMMAEDYSRPGPPAPFHMVTLQVGLSLRL